MGFNLADYQPVEDRNRQFWDKHPDGRVLTELVFHDGTRYVVRAEIYTDREDTRPAATGYAEEIVTTRGVNQTSALENCETSAEGRALARLGFAPKGARPSREEMDKANRRSAPAQRNGQEKPLDEADVAKAKLRQSCKENDWDMTIVADLFAGEQGVELKETTNAAVIETFRQSLFNIPSVQLKAPAKAAS